MNIIEIINEGPNDDYWAKAKAYRELYDLYDESRNRPKTPEDIKKATEIVKLIGRGYRPSRNNYSAGQYLDMFKSSVRKQQMKSKSGIVPTLDLKTNTRDFTDQLADVTNGYFSQQKPIKWTTGSGRTYTDPSYFVVYDDEDSYNDGLDYVKKISQEVHYRDSMNHLRTAYKIGNYLLEPATRIRGAFSDNPETTYRISISTTKTLQNTLRQVQDISSQQAAALHDIANTQSANNMEKIKNILAILQGQDDIKKVIDNSKKINPQDKAKLDAIIAGAKNFKEPDQGIGESVAPPLPKVLYHGGPKPITKFNIPPYGVYFSPHITHAQGYGDVVTAARVDAKNVYLIDYENDIDEEIMDALFDMDYRRVAKYIKLLQKQGYDAMQSISDSEMVVVFPGTPIQVIDNKQGVAEDWQKVNKKDKTDGMSKKAVNAYRKENPGSKLKTAVTKKPSEIKSGSSDDKRRKSFCARMSGMKKKNASAETKRDPDSPINKALRRWNC